MIRCFSNSGVEVELVCLVLVVEVWSTGVLIRSVYLGVGDGGRDRTQFHIMRGVRTRDCDWMAGARIGCVSEGRKGWAVEGS